MSETESFFSKSKFVQELTPNDFESVKSWKLKSKKCCAVLFYAPWCPHCKNVKGVWEDVGKKVGFMVVAAMDCEKHKDFIHSTKEDMPDLIKSYPTMIVYSNGEPKEQIGTSDRTLEYFTKTLMRICSQNDIYKEKSNSK